MTIAWVTECLFRFFFSFFGSSSVHQTGNDFRHIISHKRGIWSRSNLCVLVTGESVSPHLGRLFPDPTHNGDLCMHFLFSPTVIDNVMNGFGKEGKALQQNGSLFFLTWKQMSFKKCCCIHLQIAVEWTITGWRRGRFLCQNTQHSNWWFKSWSLIKRKETVEIL